MKLYLGILLINVILVGCSYESQSPQESFEFTTANENTNKARRILHNVAINNNLFFKDHTHQYPSGKSVVTAEAERSDGLKILLIGAQDNKTINVSIHCHKQCKSWSDIYNKTKTEFGNHWELSND
jgi:hypothetical protein